MPLLDRDESILRFNLRVLDWARRADVPLLERLRYLCIVSSNLDEFFEGTAGKPLDANAQEKSVCTVPSSPVGCARLALTRLDRLLQGIGAGANSRRTGLHRKRPKYTRQ